MSPDPILLVGGSGIVGRHVAGYLRAACQEVPLLIGGRSLAQGADDCRGGRPDGVTLDLAAHDLGLGDRPVSAVAVLLRDDAMSGFRFARERGLHYIGISTGIDEIGPEVACPILANGGHAPQNRQRGGTPLPLPTAGAEK